MKKLPTWAKVIIIIALPIGYKLGYTIMYWLLDLLNF